MSSVQKQEETLAKDAVNCLVGGFGAVIEETFRPSVIISSESNPFGNFTPVLKQQAVNSAFAKCVAQNLASIFIEYPQVQQIEIYNSFMTMLKAETDMYHKLLLSKREEARIAKNNIDLPRLPAEPATADIRTAGLMQAPEIE